ncbi:MAG TPA: DUF6600 domain-containing protein [Longimicrobiales bacterium]|nr:DUF6600 domain-containing protein [Longimicrobiales bacterium]
MNGKRIVAAFLALIVMVSGSGLGLLRPAEAQSPPPPGVGPGEVSPSQATDATPPRISYINGEVSFWRPGAEDWTAARENMPLAPGDVLYAGANGTVEVQVGPRAFVRAAENTQIGLDNQDPDYVQLRVTAGHAALDVRDLESGDAIELATPNAAFTVERAGYYRLDVSEDATTFRAHRGGAATMTPASGAPVPVSTNQQVVVRGAESPRVEAGLAMELTAWDRWNTQRTDYLIQPVTSARHVGSNVYGTEVLDRHGTWSQTETYGSVWVPTSVPSGWVPYSTGRWIWDPRYGWTWLDDAPWGWAPYHYGRWVFVGSHWGWAPGPLVVRPVYSPALVVFLGGGVSLSFGRPIHWAPLSWGEPVIPWWGRPGFIGRPHWGGWGGPRVVNNVVINRNTVVNVTNINVYRNVTVNNAVVGVPADRFGHGQVRPVRLATPEVQRLAPQHGGPGVRPVAASVTPSTGTAAIRPSEAIQRRGVVATRPAHDVRPALRAEGLTSAPATPAPAARIVPSPRAASPQGGARGAEPAQGGPGIAGPRPGAPAQRPQAPAGPGVTTPDRRQTAPSRETPAAPAAPGIAGPRPGARTAPPPAPASPGVPRIVTPRDRDGRQDARPDPRHDRQTDIDRRQGPPPAPGPGQVGPARQAPPAQPVPAPVPSAPAQAVPPRAPRSGEEGQVPRAGRAAPPAPRPEVQPQQQAPPQRARPEAAPPQQAPPPQRARPEAARPQPQAPPQAPQVEQGGPGRIERDQRRGPARPDAPGPGTPRSDQRRPGGEPRG